MQSLFQWILKKSSTHSYTKEPVEDNYENPVSKQLMENVITLYKYFDKAFDLRVKELEISGIRCAFVIIEGMADSEKYSRFISLPITERIYPEHDAAAVIDFLQNHSSLSAEQGEVRRFDDVLDQLMSGSVVIFIDGVDFAITYNIPGFSFRSISEPSNEVNLRGSREGFTEPIKINITAVRRRIKSPKLKFELMTVGKQSKTSLCIIYMEDKVSKEMLENVKNGLNRVNIDVVLDTGYLIPFLENRPKSMFRSIGTTERPDTLCGKIAEGRIGILLDGTPFALIVPYLFNENFQSLDDYSHSPYYAAFIRALKYISMFVTMLLPGLYVAIGTFHPELFPNSLLFNIATSEDATPFPMVIEAFVIHFIYEILREAGLRLPKPVGHAVSIVGALVIGDAAVTAGIVSAPMIMVVALTALSSFVVPNLYEQITVLRFAFIIVGGALGLFGVMLLFAVTCINILSITESGVPITAPMSPFSLYAQRDTVLRVGWETMAKKDMKVKDLPGTSLRDRSDLDHE